MIIIKSTQSINKSYAHNKKNHQLNNADQVEIQMNIKI